MPTDDDLEQHLLSLERYLLQPATRADVAALESLLCDDFVEFGSSGRVFDRHAIIEALSRETPAHYTIASFKVSPLADNAALVTYRVARRVEPNGTPIESLRSSVWRFVDGKWKMAFHQGTSAADAKP